MNPTAIPESARTRSLILTAGVHAMNHAVYNMMTPLALTLSRYFSFNDVSTIAKGFTIYLVCYGLFQIPIGFISDKLPRKTLLSLGLIISGISTAVVAFVPNYTMFLIGLACSGIGAATYHPVGAAYLSDLYPEAKGRALGISGIGATVGLFFGPVLGGILCKATDWRTTFIIFAVANAILGVTFQFLALEPHREAMPAAAKSGNGSGWSTELKVFLAICAAIFTLREFAGWGGYYILPMFVEKIQHADLRYAAFIGGLQSFGGFLAQPLGGWLSDKFGRRPLMAILLFFNAIFIVLIPFAGKTFLIPTVFLYSISYTATVPIIDALIADRTPSNIRGGVLGIFMATGIGIGAFSSLTLGKIIDAHKGSFQGFVTGFGILCVCVLMSMSVMLLFKNADAKKTAAAS